MSHQNNVDWCDATIHHEADVWETWRVPCWESWTILNQCFCFPPPILQINLASRLFQMAVVVPSFDSRSQWQLHYSQICLFAALEFPYYGFVSPIFEQIPVFAVSESMKHSISGKVNFSAIATKLERLRLATLCQWLSHFHGTFQHPEATKLLACINLRSPGFCWYEHPGPSYNQLYHHLEGHHKQLQPRWFRGSPKISNRIPRRLRRSWWPVPPTPKRDLLSDLLPLSNLSIDVWFGWFRMPFPPLKQNCLHLRFSGFQASNLATISVWVHKAQASWCSHMGVS